MDFQKVLTFSTTELLASVEVKENIATVEVGINLFHSPTLSPGRLHNNLILPTDINALEPVA